MSAPRSRKTFRFMPAPVLAHSIERGARALPASAFGRGLYARKLAYAALQPEAGRSPLRLLTWQPPFRYLVVWQRGDVTLTWHAPWCRRCDCPGAGWSFGRDGEYLSGLGFELSYARARVEE